MANVSFDDVELSSLGFSLVSLNGRGLPDWNVDSVSILGSDIPADVGARWSASTTALEGFLSADTENWALYNHDQMLQRFDALKAVIYPIKGFRRLIVTGDRTNRWRWARYQSMAWAELRPVFKLPHQGIGIVFQNLEPWWRQVATPKIVTTVPATVPNPSPQPTKPLIRLVISGTIAASRGARIEPESLLVMDDFQLLWKGTASDGGQLLPGDVLLVDSESLTVLRQASGVGIPSDVVRYYDYGGPGSYESNGFAIIKPGGSTVSELHPDVASATFMYDILIP